MTIKPQPQTKAKKAKRKAAVRVVSAPTPPVKKPRVSASRARAARMEAAMQDDENRIVPLTAPDDMLPDEEHPAIQQLVEVGRQKNFVTYDDILKFFPEAERDIDQLDEAHAALQAAGIEVVDTVDAEDASDDEMDEAESENDNITRPIARPRRSSGTRSPTMDIAMDPCTPPNRPETMRAMSNIA